MDTFLNYCRLLKENWKRLDELYEQESILEDRFLPCSPNLCKVTASNHNEDHDWKLIQTMDQKDKVLQEIKLREKMAEYVMQVIDQCSSFVAIAIEHLAIEGDSLNKTARLLHVNAKRLERYYKNELKVVVELKDIEYLNLLRNQITQLHKDH